MRSLFDFLVHEEVVSSQELEGLREEAEQKGITVYQLLLQRRDDQKVTGQGSARDKRGRGQKDFMLRQKVTHGNSSTCRFSRFPNRRCCKRQLQHEILIKHLFAEFKKFDPRRKDIFSSRAVDIGKQVHVLEVRGIIKLCYDFADRRVGFFLVKRHIAGHNKRLERRYPPHRR